MILNFMSNKLNLILMMCLGYIILGYITYVNNTTLAQQVFMLVVMFIIHLFGHLLGVSKGIMMATIYKKQLNAFLKKLDEYEQSGDPIDFDEIDKIIRDEEK